MSADDKQVGGGHYKIGGVEHWTVCSGMGIGYLESCATKYLMRWRKKAGLQDLEKAEHFLEKLLEMIETGAIPKNRAKINGRILNQFYLAAKIPYPESMIVDTVFNWKHAGDIQLALKKLREFIDEQRGGPTPAYVNQGD